MFALILLIHVTGQPQRPWPADGGNQGHVRQEAGDDEEDVNQHGKLASLIDENWDWET